MSGSRKACASAKRRELNWGWTRSRSAGKVGAFEGAGYVSEGIYRPSIDCRMFTLSLVDFDPVCTRAIGRDVFAVTRLVFWPR